MRAAAGWFEDLSLMGAERYKGKDCMPFLKRDVSDKKRQDSLYLDLYHQKAHIKHAI